jgi:anti-sigma factor RsiW
MAMPSKKSRRREAALSSPTPEPATRAVPRRATADRRLRILDRLTMGLAVAHIARVEGLSVQRIRRIISEMLASREVDPAAGFVQLQIARLSEAMIVARTMMMEGDLQAMDRWIRLTGELDRYHGFSPTRIPAFAEAAPSRPIAAPRRKLPASNATPVEAKAKIFPVANP